MKDNNKLGNLSLEKKLNIKDSITYFAKKWNVSISSTVALYFQGKFDIVIVSNSSFGDGPIYIAKQLECCLCLNVGPFNSALNLPITDDIKTRVKSVLNLEIIMGFDDSKVKEIEPMIVNVLDLVCNGTSLSRAYYMIKSNIKAGTLDLCDKIIIKDSIEYFAKKWNISMKSATEIYFTKKFEKIIIDDDSTGYGIRYMARQLEGYLCLEINVLNYLHELPLTTDIKTRVKDMLKIEITIGFKTCEIPEMEKIIEKVLTLVCDGVSVSEAFTIIKESDDNINKI